MDDLINELQDSSQPVETSAPAVDAEKLASENKQLFARLQKKEEELKKYKEAGASKGEFDIEEVVNLRMEGHSQDELEYIKGLARGTGRTLSEVAKDAFVRAGLEGLRAVRNSQSATPEPSARPTALSTSSKAFKDMTPEERKANFSSITAKFRRGGNSE